MKDVKGRTGMRQKLMEWGQVAPDRQRERINAARKYEQARAEYDEARMRYEYAPQDERIHAALGAALKHAQREAEIYERAYAHELMLTARAEEQRERMEARIARLNAREKQVLKMRYCKGLSWTAVARRCYLSTSAARWCERGAVDRLIEMEE